MNIQTATEPNTDKPAPVFDLTLEPLAAELYDVFYRTVGGVTYDHNPLPDWESFRKFAAKNPKLLPRLAAWFAIAQRARAHALGGTTG